MGLITTTKRLQKKDAYDRPISRKTCKCVSYTSLSYTEENIIHEGLQERSNRETSTSTCASLPSLGVSLSIQTCATVQSIIHKYTFA